jgi:hypothetical protein
MVCASCGLDNDPAATFCAVCNAALTARPSAGGPSAGGPSAGGPSAAGWREPGQPVPVAWPPPQPVYESPGGRSPLMPLLLGLGVVLLIGVIVTGVLYVRNGQKNEPAAAPVVAQSTGTTTTGPTTTGPTTTGPTTSPATASPVSAHEQAAVIDAVVDRSVASRAKLNRAIDRVRRCTGLAGALAEMRTVGAERNAEIATVASADLSAFSDGESIRSTLRSALGFALGADEHYVGWAQPTLTGGCGPSAARTAAWDHGQAVSTQAQAAKQQFVAVWNPVAVSLGFPARNTEYF